MRSHFKNSGIHLEMILDNYKKTLMIDMKTEATKTSCEFKLLVLFKLSLTDLNISGSFWLIASCADGSGTHQVRQQYSKIQSLNTDGENKK